MEAVGFAASIITLISAASLTGSTLTRLWGLRGSPLYVVSALNEVTDFTATLNLVQSTLSVAEVPEDVLAELERLLARAKDRLEAFDKYLKQKVLREDEEVHNMDQLKLRRRAKFKEVVGEAQQQINGLQQGLLSIKVNLTLALGVAQVRTKPRLFTSIQQVSVVGAGGTSVSLMGTTERASTANKIEQAAALYHPNQPRDVTGLSGHDGSSVQSYIKIETKPLSRTCQRRCPCQCHIPVKAATPRWLQGLIGAAFVNLTGTPLLNHRSCNIKNCDDSRHGTGSVRFSYLFPIWLLRTGIVYTASWCDVSGIGGSWSLKMPRIVTGGWLYSKMYVAIERDSTTEVQHLMAMHGIRAYDSFAFGPRHNLLDIALMHGREDIFCMLLDYGADVHFQVADGLTSAQFFWKISLRNNSLVRLRNHPELEIIHDDLGWTVTHDYISIGDAAYLPHQLQLDPQFVQLRDCWGATALHWAAYYANMEAISALLSAGADVNAVCKNGESVLFWASYSESVTCCRAIINSGADVELTNSIEENVLMSIVSNASPSEDIVELFLFSGITIESRDFDGSTALMRAVGYSSLPICVLLLDYGAEIDNRDSAGRSAVWDAILWNRHANLQLLIDRGASLTFLDIDGDSIIVQAALFADLDTTNILEEARIEGLPMNPGSVDHYWSWFNNNRDWYFTGQRPPLEDEKEAFQALLDSIIPCSDPPPPNTVETLDIPGAYPIEPTDELDSSTNSEFEESSDESETDN